MEKLCGYVVEQDEYIPDIEAQASLLLHEKTGAKHLHIASEDSNNTFR